MARLQGTSDSTPVELMLKLPDPADTAPLKNVEALEHASDLEDVQANRSLATSSMSSAKGSFHHEPLLHQNGDQVRLIRLERGSIRELSFSMIHVELEKAPAYIAMSYMWGNGQADRPVQIDGKVFLVRPTVEEMLHSVVTVHSSPDEDFYLWIDQICIDQGSVDDKNDQVGKMGKIYANANFVVAWLSSSLDVDRAAAELKLHVTSDSNVPTLYPLENVLHGKLLKNDKLCEAIEVFLNNDYWTRTWVLQELILAKKVHLLTRSHTVSSAIIRTLIEAVDVQALQFTIKLKIPKLSHLRFFVMWVERGDEKSVALGSIMDCTRYSCCSDPRDQVFAVRSLLADQIQAKIVVDYALNVEDVFLNVADMILAGEQHPPGVRSLRRAIQRVIGLGQSMMPGLRDEWEDFGGSQIRDATSPEVKSLVEVRAKAMKEMRRIVGKEEY